MKKHLPVIVIVVLLLLCTYLFGHTSTTTAPSSIPTFNKQQYSLADPTSPWVIVNKTRALEPITYAPADLADSGNGQQLRMAAAKQLQTLLFAAQKAGFTLTPQSGYRSYETQQKAYASEVKAYGQPVADNESARPGFSEHQTGWAVDLGTPGCNIDDCFATTPGGKWAIDNAYRYGFILRYPSDKTAITGYRHEAWHFRYVGKSLAAQMHKQHVTTLEEFFGLPAAPDYQP